MTRKETGAIIDKLSRLYMLQMRRLSKSEIAIMVDTWADQFKDTPYATVNRAVDLYAQQGKAFLPGVPDIINEILRLEEVSDSKLYTKLIEAARMAAEPEERLIMVDPGGFRWSEEHQREIWVHAECKYVRNYTLIEFSSLPMEIQIYAEDIEGLKSLHKEILTDLVKARTRFLNALPYIRNEMEARAS